MTYNMTNNQKLSTILRRLKEKDLELINNMNKVSGLGIDLELEQVLKNEIILRGVANDFETESTDTIIRDLSVKIAQYIFYNNPGESLPSGKNKFENCENLPRQTSDSPVIQITEDEINSSNKYMVDRIAYILSSLLSNNYSQLGFVFNQYKPDANSCDFPDIEKVEREMEQILSNMDNLDIDDI